MAMNPRLLRPTRRNVPSPGPQPPANTDALFSQVILLLHMNGTNGSTSLVDSSPQSRSVAAYGDAAISTAQSKFGGASGKFNGEGDYLHCTDFSAWRPGKNGEPFTVELWAYRNTSDTQVFVAKHGGTAWGGTLAFELFTDSSDHLQFLFWDSGDGVTGITSDAAVPLGQWVHLAVVYDGTTTQLFIDGQADATTGTAYGEVLDADKIQISGELNDSFNVNGYLDEVRITKAARYTINQNFTPPTAAFPNS